MTPFTRVQGRFAVLDRADVDTDQIIPKQFLTRLERSGYGLAAFHGWRYRSDDTPDPAFPLNAPEARGAAFLVTGPNFGCGSSREHAVWALRDMGFRAILAPSFADIFAANCVNSGLLPAVVAEPVRQALLARAASDRWSLAIDLERGVLVASGFCQPFTVAPRSRARLLAGLDAIGDTLRHESGIAAFERGWP